MPQARRHNNEKKMIDHLISAAVIVLAYSLRGMTGFGSTILAVPALALMHPLQLVVPAVVVLDVAASLVLAAKDFPAVHKGEIARLLPFGILGALLGTAAFMTYPSRTVIYALAVAAIAFGVRIAWRRSRTKRISGLWAVPAGLIGSSSGSLFGMPYMVYLAQRVPDKRQLRATFSSLFVVDGGLRVALMSEGGVMTSDVQDAIVFGVLPMAAGLYVGHRLHERLDGEALVVVLGLTLVAGGIYLMLV